MVVIPHIFTIEEKIRIQRIRLQMAAGLLLIVGGFAVVIDQAVIPLDVLWSVIIKIGWALHDRQIEKALQRARELRNGSAGIRLAAPPQSGSP